MTPEPTLLWTPSPNHGPRPPDASVDMLLLHYTGMRSAEAALVRLCDPAAEVSAHYLIDEDGSISHLVADDRRAWHAGVSCWAGRQNLNDVSIGIELVNPGHEFGYRAFPEAQMRALETLASSLMKRHSIPARRVLGHSDVAPSRKQDPGELFDWARLARRGIGLWPGPDATAGRPRAARVCVRSAQALLARIGYAVPCHGRLDEEMKFVVSAFQRHFRQERVDGILDDATFGRIRAVADAFDD